MLSGTNLAGDERLSLTILGADGKPAHVIDRDAFNALNASRKADREGIAWRIRAIVERHGASVEQHDDRREITLAFSLNGVGALIYIDAVHGGALSLVHWHNTGSPVRNFSRRFCGIVGEAVGARLHHKATSCPANWFSLAMLLDGGLCLAFANEAFEPFDL